jgi:hypothetical protein
VTLELDEKRLRFSFDDDWRVVRWDRHPAYTDGIRALPGTKAVDFVAVHRGEPHFIEVTDFREHRIETKQQLASGDLVDEVASKVRDTLAGLIWACGRAPLDERHLASFVGPLVYRSRKVPVIVWLEEDRLPDGAELDVLQVAIKKKLLWLNAKVLVTSRLLAEQKPLPGVLVTSLPRSS